MKLLDRYLVKELLVPFMVGTVGVVLMFQANMLIAYMKQFPLSSVPLTGILQLIVFKTPFFLSLTLPVGMSLGSSLALSRLTRESELVAMRSAGASIRRIMVPIFLFGVFVAVGQFWMVETLMPKAEKAANKLMVRIMILGGAPDFKSNVVIHLQNYTVNFGTVMRSKDGTVQFSDALLFEHPQVNVVDVLQAKTGSYKNGMIVLDDAYWRRFRDDELIDAKSKGRMGIDQQISVDEMFTPEQPLERGIDELRAEIRERKKMGQDTTSSEVQYHIRYAVPASCAVFAIAGPVFAIWLGRGGGFVGVLMSLLVVMLYYNLFVISTDIFTKNGWLSPFAASWFANAVFIVLAVIGLRRLE